MELSAHLQETNGEYTFTNSVDSPETCGRIMLVHRQIENPSGDLLGTIAAAVNRTYYENLFSVIEVGNDGNQGTMQDRHGEVV